MNDLRSLEGIGQLLSQKYTQTNKHKLKSRHIRRNSDSLISCSTPTPTTNTTTPISEYFPPEIASLLSNNIQMGYYSNLPSQAPVLLKSHSDFVREDTINYISDSELPIHCINSPTNDTTNGDCIVLTLPTEENHTSPLIMGTDREQSQSLTQLSLAMSPLVLDSEHNNTDNIEYITTLSQLPMDMLSYDTCDEEDNDMELFDIKNDYMQYVNGNNLKNRFNLGNGASGIVKKAFHYRSCKMVAIKQCRSKQKHEINAFLREAQLYKEFEANSNIINMFNYGKDIDSGDLYIALECMDLGSLDQMNVHCIKDMREREMTVAYIMCNVLKGLDSLHSKLYVHNDIKCANVLCNKYGSVKLGDFGTVLRLDTKHSYLMRNNGTQRYQSPEKITKEVCKYNSKTDIWSLGVMCYELLFGPRNDDNELSYTTNPPILTPKKHGLSPQCCDFVNKCLIFDDKQRPLTQELLSHLWFKDMHKRMENGLNNMLWPWLVTIGNGDSKINEICREKEKKQNSKRRSLSGLRNNQYYNEDLLFMISALIINYSKQNVNLNMNECNEKYDLHRRISYTLYGNTENRKGFSDEQRIQNMAHYALCTTQMVIQRIRVTVAYIKSQLNKTEVSRIDS